MTTPVSAAITFPSAALTPLGATLLEQGIDENLWFTFTPPGGGQSIIFYLKGGLSSIAPGVPGLDGIVIQSTSGLTAPFKHIDLQAARQDGVTNNGSVYDPAVITLMGEMHAATPQGLDAVRDAWMGAWNPRIPGVLEYITIDGGYWRADVRLESTWQDTIKTDRRYLYRPMSHKCRVDNAFWYGVPSTSQFLPSFETFGDTLSADAVSDPIAVIQTAHGTTLPLSFADTVTAGNTVVVIAMGGIENITRASEITGPTLNSATIPGTFSLWDTTLLGIELAPDIASDAVSNDSVLSGWVLPNCGPDNGINFTTFEPTALGFVAYEVAGLGELPTLASVNSTQSTGSTEVSSGASPAIPVSELFVVGGASTFSGSNAGSTGFTSTEAASTAWAGFQIPTASTIPPVTTDSVGEGFALLNPDSILQSWAHDIGPDANYLVAFVNVCTTITPLCTASVTSADGSEVFEMTPLGQVAMDFGEIVFAFGLVDPPTGNVKVNAEFFAVTVFTLFGGNSVSLIGVGTVTPAVTSNGSHSNPLLETGFSPDQYVLNAIGAFNDDGGANVTLSDYNQTQLFAANNFGGEAIFDIANFNTSLLIGDNSGSSDPTFSATVQTVSAFESWCSIAIGFNPAVTFTWAQTELAAGTWAAGVAAIESSAQYGPLSARWDITYSSGHTGSIELQAGVGAVWVDAGVNDTSQTGLATLVATDAFPTATTATDFQIVSIQIGDSFEGLTFGGEAATIIRGRVGTGGEVQCIIQDSQVSIARVVSGVTTVMYTTDLLIPPQQNEIWTFFLGADLNEPRSYSVSRSGFSLFGFQFDGHSLFPTFTEVGTGSLVGSSNRGVGFGMVTAAGIFGFAQAVSAPVAGFAAADNNDSAQTGFVQLSNIGTEEGWATHVVTGPGTFGFGDGPGSATMISLGPLAVGQTAVVTTGPPRLRAVVDAADPTNNLYPLLNGRFQNPIPGVPLPSQAAAVQIPVSITDGSAASSIVSTVTPRRIHPV